MTAMTATAAPAAAWTLVYTAAGAVTINAHNPSNSTKLRVRIGAAVVIGDALTSASIILQCEDTKPYTLAIGDKVMVQPVGADAGSVLIWA